MLKEGFFKDYMPGHSLDSEKGYFCDWDGCGTTFSDARNEG